MRIWHSFGMRPPTFCTGRLWAAQGRRGSAVVAARVWLPAGSRLGLAALQVVAQGRSQAVLPGPLRRLGRGGPGAGMLGLWLIGRHRGPLAKLSAELADAGPWVNRDSCVLGGGSARGVPRVHQALEGADILAVAPPALEVLPPAPHGDDHDPSPRVESGSNVPVSWGVGYRPGMIGRWPNCGKLMKVTEKSGFFRALPWLAQSGIVRAVFRGRRPAARLALP